MDIFLLVFIVALLILGFFWGAVRSVMLLAAWLVAFLAGAYLQLELGSYLASQWTDFVPTWSVMAAYLIIFAGIMLTAPALVYVITRTGQRLTRYQTLDDLVGAFFAVFVAVLTIASVMIVLSTYYGADVTIVDPAGGPQWSASLYQDLLESSIGSGIDDTVVPILGTILGPLLPPEVRDVFG